ncbi:MAG TPA: hypothetical protein VMZ51_01855 [Acidimicrobiales bacterium]|nr:hypothetical protein [Acidimicrobiales bacterium]
MPVTLISSAAELPSGPSAGLFVLVQEEPVDCAVAVAELLDSNPPLSPAQAADVLTARAGGRHPAERALDPARYREAALDLAREQAAEALARVPSRARGVAPERLAKAAAAVGAAEEAIVDARAVLGERPELPAEAAQAALDADEAVVRAQQRRALHVERSSSLLMAANALGILIIAGRIRTTALDPIFVLVAVFPVTALVHLVANLGWSTWQARSAARRRAAALRSTGMATMTGLVARHARLTAWTERADALANAEASLVQARRRWAALTGASGGPASVAALMRVKAEADRRAAAVVELENQPVEPVPGVDPERPLVILVNGAAGDPLDDQTRSLLRLLDEEDPSAPVVLVTACAGAAEWAEARSENPGGQVVDIRQRVLASLDRLRARAAGFGDHGPPSSLAAEG